MEQIGIYKFDKRNDELGHGAFGRVYKGHDNQNKEVAIKVVKNIAGGDELKEIEVLQKLKNIKNENLVRLLEFKKSRGYAYLVMDFCNAGDLGSFLYKYGNLNEDEIRHLFHQTSNGLSVLNQLNIVHRDLKPENMLLCNPRKLSSPKPQDLIVKVADFGLARFLPNGALASTWCGTALYMAPEVLLRQKYNSQADLWSIGMIIYESLTGSLPKYDDDIETIEDLIKFYQQGKRLDFPIPLRTSNILSDLLKNLLQENANNRLKFEQFRVHNFFNNTNVTPPVQNVQKQDVHVAQESLNIEKNPLDANAYSNRGIAQYNLGKYNEAIADFTKAIELDPTCANAYYNRGLAQYNLGKYNEAIAGYTKAIELNPTYAIAYNNRGLTQGNLGKYNEAIADYTKAIELNPLDAIIYNNRGVAQSKLEKHNEAITDYTKAIELDPTYAYAYNNRGRAQNNLGKYNEAIADFTKGIELDPTYADAYYGRGVAQSKLGKHNEAIADYTNVIELNPTDAGASFNRGNAQYRLGKYNEAIADFTKAIELDPADAIAYINRGIVQDKLGKYNEAIADYTKANELNPNLADAYNNRGLAQNKF